MSPSWRVRRLEQPLFGCNQLNSEELLVESMLAQLSTLKRERM
jgi:hypothetical protein